MWEIKSVCARLRLYKGERMCISGEVICAGLEHKGCIWKVKNPWKILAHFKKFSPFSSDSRRFFQIVLSVLKYIYHEICYRITGSCLMKIGSAEVKRKLACENISGSFLKWYSMSHLRGTALYLISNSSIVHSSHSTKSYNPQFWVM